jgi:microcystin-dependent protein
MANLQDITNRSEVGTIKPWGKATAPAGYLLCDGAAVSRTTYADLFTVIGTTYGTGDNSTTFNVPDLQGKFPQGKSGTTNLATTGGANTVTVSVTNNQAATNSTNQTVSITGSIDNTSLTESQLGSHDHTYDLFMSPATGFGGGAFRANALHPPTQEGSTANAGSGTGHNHSHTLSGTLTGNITTSLTGDVTASGTNAFSPFVIVQYIIKH